MVMVAMIVLLLIVLLLVILLFMTTENASFLAGSAEVTRTGRSRSPRAERPLRITTSEDETCIELGKVLRLGLSLAARVRVIGFADWGDGAWRGVRISRGRRRALFYGTRVGTDEELGSMPWHLVGLG